MSSFTLPEMDPNGLALGDTATGADVAPGGDVVIGEGRSSTKSSPVELVPAPSLTKTRLSLAPSTSDTSVYPARLVSTTV